MTITFEQAEILKQKEIITDDDGIERPIFPIGDKKVAFRTRQEVPSFIESGQKYHLASPLDATPLVFERDDNPPDFVRFSEASQESPSMNAIEMVTATPEGLVGAAIEMGATDPSLLDVQASLRSGEYSADSIQLIDTIAAALNFDDSGEKLAIMETDGLALVLASLTGDKKATDTLEGRRQSMYEFFDAQKELKATESKNLPEIYNEVESIDPRNVVLVHSTVHDVLQADDGSTILRPSSAFNRGGIPRASIHFTPNGQVSSHYAGSWGRENSLIVSNFAEVVSENDAPLGSMSSADTWFAVNPGQALKMPDVRIVTADFDGSGDLIRQEGNTLTYRDSSEYTEQEKVDIKQLASEYKIINPESFGGLSDVLREIALRKAMQQKGASWFVRIGAHYAEDEEFQKKYTKLASELNTNGELHIYTGDGRAEEAAALGMGSAGQFNKKTNDNDAYNTFPRGATLENVRWVIAGGYIPGRPYAPLHDKPDYGEISYS